MVKQYPDNIVPQLRSVKPGEPMPCLTCPPDTELQSLVFEGSNIAVIKGWEYRTNIDLKNFFQPIDSYAEYQVTIPEGETKSISFGPMANATGSIEFLMVFPQYQNTNIETQDDWKMKWRTTGSTAWNGLGRILLLSGTSDIKIDPIEISNTSPADIEIKILLAN